LNTLFAQAQAAGAQIHTNSWGASVAGQYTTDARNTDLYTWNHKDFTILFAATNEGVDSNFDGRVDLDSMGAPATAKNCITVGATENDRLYGGVNPEHAGDPWDEVQCTGNGGGAGWGNCWPSDFPADPILADRLSDHDTGMAAFSSRGPTDDGRIKPDIVAPGTNVLSTRSQGQYVSSGWGSGENPYYQFMGGTSMATPLTAGGTALVRQFYTDMEGFIPSSALIKATLINSAVDVYPGQYTSPVEQWPDRLPNHVQGWGRVNVSNATDGSHVYEDIADGNGVNTGESDNYVVPVCTAGTFKVTLVWTDYPGSTAASSQLVNDLDLSVTAPNGTTTYLGNVFSNGWSTIGGSADRVNNVESVYLQSPSAGDWIVSVSGYNIAQGMGPGYALVMDMANNTCTPDFTIRATPSSQDICMGDDAIFDVDLGSIAGFADLVDLSTHGQPAGTTTSFSADPVPPPGSSVLIVGNTGAASAGTYSIDVIGTSGALVHQDTVTLNLQDPISISPTLTAPADGSTQQPTMPTFTWDVLGQALGYDIEIATDPGITDVVDSATGLPSASYTPATLLSSNAVYYWHVRATNSCGTGSYSPVSAFRTEPLVVYDDCRNPGVAIPDGSGSISDNMSVADSGPIVDLDVYLNVDHTWVGDLDFIVHDLDTGTSVMIVDRPGLPASTYGCSGDNMDVTLDDEGTLSAEDFCSDVPPALYGHLIPNNPLSAFDGAELAGNWRITVADHAIQDSGTLNGWCLVATVSLDVPADYSDLPSSYGVAWHTGDGTLRLGTNWHADTSFEEGDDNSDDDGITLDPNGNWQPGASVTIYADVTGSGGYLAGWFDWNDDGDMADAQEQAIARNVSVGFNTIVFAVPTEAGYTENRPVNARFRMYAAEPGGLLGTETSVGEATGGEVEDYRLDPQIPTAVELARFEAVSEGTAIRLEWETVTEVDLLGFDLCRANSPDGSLTRLNGQQIPAQMPGSPTGATYTYMDQTAIPGTSDYCYWLRAVNTYGAVMDYGPIPVTASPALRYGAYLPVVSR
jgi:subtilisin-like proprotein convertase family protein